MSTPVSITIHNAFLPHNDKDASLAFYRDLLGFEVRNDVGYNGMHWITVGHPDQPGMSLVLHPPAADPDITDDERRTITEMMAKGTYAILTLATPDLDVTFARLGRVARTSSRSRSSSRGAFATALSVIPQATCSASTRYRTGSQTHEDHDLHSTRWSMQSPAPWQHR